MTEETLNNANEVAQSELAEQPVRVEQQTSEETANQPEETLEESISQLDALYQKIKGGEKEGFLKKFSDYFNRDQKRAEREINKIAKKEGRDLVKIKNEIKNHEDKYAANVILYGDIVKDQERLSSLKKHKMRGF